MQVFLCLHKCLLIYNNISIHETTGLKERNRQIFQAKNEMRNYLYAFIFWLPRRLEPGILILGFQI